MVIKIAILCWGIVIICFMVFVAFMASNEDDPTQYMSRDEDDIAVCWCGHQAIDHSEHVGDETGVLMCDVVNCTCKNFNQDV